MINSSKIKGRMKELGFTQVSISQVLGINPSTFNRKINDQTGKYLSLDEAKKIAELLKIGDPTEYFFCNSLAYKQESKN